MAGSLKPSDSVGDCACATTCFDSSRAQFPIRVVPAAQVLDLFTTTHAPERIESYRQAMVAGERFPPISVIRIGPRFVITDGHKRFRACQALGADPITVELWPLRRLLDDQLRQFRRTMRRIATVAMRAARHPEGRKDARRLYWDTVGHWKRIALSAASRSRRLAAIGTRADPAAPVFSRLLRDCLRLRGHLLLVFLSLAILGGSQLYLTWIAKLWEEGPLLSGNRAAMSNLMARAAFTALAMVLGIFFSRYSLRAVDLSLVQSLRDRAQERLLETDLTLARRFQTGDLMSRLFNDAGALSEFVREILRRGVGETLVVVGATAMLFRLNWRLALVTGVMVPAVALPLVRLGKLVRKWGTAAQRAAGELGATLNEQLNGLTTIKGFGAERMENDRFVARDLTWRRQVMRSEFWSAALISSVWLIAAAGLLAVVWYGSRLVSVGRATAGGLLAFCLYAVQTVEPLRRLGEVHSMSQRAIACATRVYEIIDLPPSQRDGSVALATPVRGELRFEQVNLSFDAHQVLKDFNLRVAAGETIALVGGSGAGKSTIANLVLRFLEPNAGRIVLDGHDLAELRMADLRRAVCVAEQDPFIFSGSLLDNIRYGAWNASRRQIEEAVLLAGLQAYVASMPLGLDTYLTESGRNLSGGQRQRIALARTIARDPGLLILDEATSALDSDTERTIFANLKEWLERRTVIVMAHRLATITRFERVAMLQDGAIIGEGSVPGLLEACAPFRELFADQLNPVESERERSFS
ncbi:MAG TPA: ABC transporter transmembrane domain-containing protein [Candidatus Binataceae bacterium]